MGKSAKTGIIKDKVGSLINRAGYRVWVWVWSNEAERIKDQTLYATNGTVNHIYESSLEALYW